MLISVRVDALRAGADELAGTGFRLANGLAGVPGLTVSAPGWATGPALTAAEYATHRWLGGLAGRVAAVGAALRLAAGEYDATDERAARRLAAVR